MVSFGRTKKTKSVQAPVFHYLPGQQEYIPRYAQTWQRIFEGDMTSPPAQALQTLIGEAGMREAAQQRRQIMETRGLTTPAKQRAIAGLGEQATKVMAGVPQQLFTMAADWLGQYTLTPPSVGTVGKSSGGGGWNFGICSCDNLKALNEGKVGEALRQFRDAHFSPFSDLEKGYKAMSEWFVPFVKGNKVAMWLGRHLLFLPLAKVAEWTQHSNSHGFLFLPFMYFWIWTWKLYGRVTKKRYREKTPRPLYTYYPPMSLTFFNRLKEVF